MTEHDRNHTFDWIPRAYATTPPPTSASRERAVTAVRNAMQNAVATTPIRRSMRWMPAITLLAAACVLVAWWNVMQRRNLQRSRSAIAVAVAPSGVAPSAVPASSSAQDENTHTTQNIVPPTVTGATTPGLTSAKVDPGETVGNPVDADNVMSAPMPSHLPATPSVHDHTPGEPASIPPALPSVAAHPVPPAHSADLTHPTPSAVDGLDAESAMLVTRILDSATAQELPTAALVARVREGVRRHVPGPRIVVVTRNYAAALADARSALGRTATPGELQSGAEALLAGTSVSALQQLRAARHSAPPKPVGSDHPVAPRGATPILPQDSVSTH